MPIDNDTEHPSETTVGPAPEAETPAPDPVEAALAEVRADLDRRRSTGELPHLPPDELTRHFDGVVEAVDAGLVEHPPLDPGDLTGPAVLETWRPFSGAGLLARVLAKLLSPITRVSGVLVRRQVAEFSTRTAAVVEELAIRQNRTSMFLSRAFLDRQRRLEYRVAELEREVLELRSRERPPGPETAARSDPAPSEGGD